MTFQSAILNNNLNEVKRLLSLHDASLYTMDEQGNTPIHYACLYKQPIILETLIRAGFSVNCKNYSGENAIMFAFKCHGTLRKKKMEQKEVRRKTEMLVRILLKYDVNINEINSSGDTCGDNCLHMAVKGAMNNLVSKKCIQLLLENGADISCENKLKLKPQHIAFNNGLREIGELILFSTSTCKKYPVKNRYEQFKRHNESLPEKVDDKFISDILTEISHKQEYVNNIEHSQIKIKAKIKGQMKTMQKLKDTIFNYTQDIQYLKEVARAAVPL